MTVGHGVLRVATFNVHQFLGAVTDGNYSVWSLAKDIFRPEKTKEIKRVFLEKIREWLQKEQFDIVCLQEVYQGSRFRRVKRKQLFDGLGYQTIIPHMVGAPLHWFENVLLSKLPILKDPRHNRWNFLLPHRIYGIADTGFTLVPLEFNGQVILVGNTHLHPYSSEKREKQAHHILLTLKKMRDIYGKDVPIIFLGDFNTVPPGAFAGPFQDGEDDDYKEDQTFRFLQSKFSVFIQGDNLTQYTYPAAESLPLRLEHPPNRTLDYILFSKHVRVKSYQARQDIFLSDHYPVIAELVL